MGYKERAVRIMRTSKFIPCDINLVKLEPATNTKIGDLDYLEVTNKKVAELLEGLGVKLLDEEIDYLEITHLRYSLLKSAINAKISSSQFIPKVRMNLEEE